MKTVLSMLAMGTAMIATSAMAQDTTGTVNITGSVAPKCLVVPGAGSTFDRTVALGELAGTDGKLRPNLEADFNAAAVTARVVCTTTPSASAQTALSGSSGTDGRDDACRWRRVPRVVIGDTIRRC